MLLRLAFAFLTLAVALPPLPVAAYVVGHVGFDGADIALVSHSIDAPRRMSPRRHSFGVVGPDTGMAAALADDTVQNISGARRWLMHRHMALGIYGVAEHARQGNVFGATGLRNGASRRRAQPATLRFDFAFGEIVSLDRLTMDMAAMGRFRAGDGVHLTLLLDGQPHMTTMLLEADPLASFTYAAMDDGSVVSLDAPLVNGEGQPLDNRFSTMVMALSGVQASTATLMFEMVMGSRNAALALDNITLEAFSAVPGPASLVLLVTGCAVLTVARGRRGISGVAGD
ncbi:MAG: hypothetical protein AAF899_05485 [Pseudomonadota bacterium]